MARMKCQKCGGNMKVVVIGSNVAYVACPKCNPDVFEKNPAEILPRNLSWKLS